MENIQALLSATKKSSIQVARLSAEEKTNLVKSIAEAVDVHSSDLIMANEIDTKKLSDNDPKKDRLILNKERIGWMVGDAQNVANLEDPSGKILTERVLENGVRLQKLAVPMGIIGIIYESRPNVTLDAISLSLKSGNAVVLRGGTDATHSNQAIVKVVHEVLQSFDIDTAVVQLLPTDRKFVKELLEAEKYVDLIIPRGSQGLINFVRENAKIPTIETGAGVCHTFVEKTANLAMAKDIVCNAKLQRPSVCNSLDTILVSAEVASDFLPTLVADFSKYETEIYADERAFEILKEYSFLKKAKTEDFGREFLGYGCSVKVVDSFDEALNHVAQYSSRHSEAIVTEDKKLAETFLTEVDAAAVYHNASTRFSDGAVFGLGAEIGISTQKLHARGPFALEKLVTEKWVLRGEGQVRE